MFKIPYLDLPRLDGVSGTVRLPGSKSISNRALLLAALSAGRSRIEGLLHSDDTAVMLDCLQQLGCVVVADDQSLEVEGLALGAGQRGQLRGQADLFLGNAGTAMRPLAAALAVMGGDYRLSGVPRMHERPIGDLVSALQDLGCAVSYTGTEGYPPLHIGSAAGLRLAAPIQVRGDVSSQFLTALLMALPLATATEAATIEVVGNLISVPYIDITLRMMAQFGVTVQREGWQRFVIPAGARYQSPGLVSVEADASSASYFIAAAGLAASADAPLRIEGVGADAIQGDIRFVEAAQSMGVRVVSGAQHLEVSRDAWPLRAISLDCNHIPDAAMTLAVLALFAEGTTELRNIGSWRVKETDRIAAMQTELQKLGAEVTAGPDWIRITAPVAGAWRMASVATYDDHRMAMCLSLAAFHSPVGGIRIEDPQCVAKTYPDYFEALFAVSRSAAVPVLCVDGPTASGKGTLSARLAAALGYAYLDSGALYRVLALAAQQAGVDWADEAGLAQLALTLPLRFEGGQVLLAGRDVDAQIRSEAIGSGASQVSQHPAVRSALLAVQHGFQRLPGLVADGRDMGTVIFPDSPLKVFLTASAEQRAQRRVAQIAGRGGAADYAAVLADLQARDARDQNRSAAPLKPASDAQLLDNSALGVEESLAQVLDWWRAARGLAEA